MPAQLAPEYAVKSALRRFDRCSQNERGKALHGPQHYENRGSPYTRDARDRTLLEGNTLVIELSARHRRLPKNADPETRRLRRTRSGQLEKAPPPAADRRQSQPAASRPATTVRNVRSGSR